MPIVTMLNQKGGVGKTSCTHHLAGTLAQMGRRVLLVDNDPQSSLTQGLWGPVVARQLDPARTIAAIYAGDLPYPEQVIHPTGIPGIDLIPGSGGRPATTSPTRTWPTPRPRRASASSWKRSGAGYDLVMIDCPPNLHLC